MLDDDVDRLDGGAGYDDPLAPPRGPALAAGAGWLAWEPVPDAADPNPAAGVAVKAVSVTTFSVVVTGGVWAAAPASANSRETDTPGSGAETMVARGRMARYAPKPAAATHSSTATPNAIHLVMVVSRITLLSTAITVPEVPTGYLPGRAVSPAVYQNGLSPGVAGG